MFLVQGKILTESKKYIGIPYSWGSKDPKWFDCSGYVIMCIRSLGLSSTGSRIISSERLMIDFEQLKLGI